MLSFDIINRINTIDKKLKNIESNMKKMNDDYKVIQNVITELKKGIDEDYEVELKRDLIIKSK